MPRNKEAVLRIVHFDIKEQAESDAFIRRIAECKTKEEVKEIIHKVKDFLEEEDS